MAYDPAYTDGTNTGFVILYGGRDDTTVFSTTYYWDGSAWNALFTAHSPDQLRSARMVYDETDDEIVLFGGSTSLTDSSTTASSKTFLFHNHVGGVFDWKNCSNSCNNAMPKLISPALAYDDSSDATAGKVLEFGGDNPGGGLAGNTYSFDGSTWTQEASTGPPAIAAAGMTYDDGRGYVLLYGGNCTVGDPGCPASGYYGGSMKWTGTAWSALSLGSPGQRTAHKLAYDPGLSTPAVVTFGGIISGGSVDDTWRLGNSTSWTQCSSGGTCATHPVARNSYGLAYDTRHSILILMGGGDTQGTSLPEGGDARTYYSDTWTFANSGWTCVAAGASGCT